MKYFSCALKKINLECAHQEVFIDHDTEMCLRHEAVWVQEAEDGDGGGQEDAQHLGDEVSIGIV